MKNFVIHKQDALRRENCRQYIDELDPGKKWRVTICEYRKRRSNEQNSYIHAVPLKIMSDHTGYTMDEMKEYCCGEFTGWEGYSIMGKTLQRPIRSTSQMDTEEMSRFIEWMIWFGSSTLNLRIPSPNEWDGEY